MADTRLHKINLLEQTIFEANRFIERAKTSIEGFENEDNYTWIGDSKANGATKRASMDLTRALANYRKG